jgi:hypothetical protein
MVGQVSGDICRNESIRERSAGDFRNGKIKAGLAFTVAKGFCREDFDAGSLRLQ